MEFEVTLNVEWLLLLIYWDFHITNTSGVYRGWPQKEEIFSELHCVEQNAFWCQEFEENEKLFGDQRKATLSQTTTGYKDEGGE